LEFGEANSGSVAATLGRHLNADRAVTASGEVVSFALLRAWCVSGYVRSRTRRNASPLSGPDPRAVFSGSRLNRISILFNYW
jgi:hypothetical protein